MVGGYFVERALPPCVEGSYGVFEVVGLEMSRAEVEYGYGLSGLCRYACIAVGRNKDTIIGVYASRDTLLEVFDEEAYIAQ